MKDIIFGILVISLLGGCGQQPDPNSTLPQKQASIRTDAGPISRRLPKLGPLRAVWWQSTEITTNSVLSPPAHPAYRVRGFAQLETSKADELSRNYEWQKMPPGWSPDVSVTNTGLDLSDWSNSAAFTKECKPQALPGQLFFARASGVVYFDIEVE